MRIENDTLIFEEGDLFENIPSFDIDNMWEHDMSNLTDKDLKWLISNPSWDNEDVMTAMCDTHLLIALKDEYLARLAKIDQLFQEADE